MSYVVKTHDGKVLTLKNENASDIAALSKRLDLTAVTLASGEIVYLSKGTVARIEKITSVNNSNEGLPKPDFRGTISSQKFKELRNKLVKSLNK